MAAGAYIGAGSEAELGRPRTRDASSWRDSGQRGPREPADVRRACRARLYGRTLVPVMPVLFGVRRRISRADSGLPIRRQHV